MGSPKYPWLPKSHCYNWIIKRKHPFEKITLEVNIMNKVVAF